MATISRLHVRACVFDAYGTLFDFASAAARVSDILGDKTAAVSSLWRDKQLQYTWLRALQGRHAPFMQVTADALDFVLDTFGIADASARERLLAAYRTLECFPEVPGVLDRLKSAGFKTAILSNGTRDMLSDAMAAAGITRYIDLALSVDEVGVFKTHPRVYQLAVDRLQVPASMIAFQSSNGWDAYAASDFGMRVVWCNRYSQKPERLPGSPDLVVPSLADLPGLLELA